MRRMIAISLFVLCSPSFGCAQGIQGSVKFSGKWTMRVSGHTVTLSWVASPGASAYNVYRGTSRGGPYARIATGVLGTKYADAQITHTQTLYYVTTAVSGSSESANSNEIVAAIP
jgi:fibronectin type 3 domain-containing protein